jgi:very-short-patch-repair endonuclease
MAERRTVERARKLRRVMTVPEVVLWLVLRGRPNGLRFRRQHPAGVYVLDFYCPAARLAIEIDGVVHDMGDNPARDERRDAWLQSEGFDILRIPAREVMGELEAVIALILQRCAFPLHHASRGPPPHPADGED